MMKADEGSEKYIKLKYSKIVKNSECTVLSYFSGSA